MICALLAGGRFFSCNVQTAARAAWLRLAAGALFVVLATASCAKDPTEVVVIVYSDVPCDALAAVAAGPVGELGDRPASAVSTVCDAKTGARGALVLVPKSDDSGELAVEVRIRTDQGQPDDCVASNDYKGCIVSRRILNYIPGRTVHMRIDLRNPCLDTPCSQTTTCVAEGLSKACLAAQIDPNQCSGDCTDQDLVTQSGSKLDACAEGKNPCADPDSCMATNDGASCVCASGYEHPAGDSLACVDSDECAATPAPCAAHATCKNTDGAFTCTCQPGYEGDGKTCQLTMCQPACGKHASCEAAGSAFACKCDAGYSGDGSTCTDIDECAGGKADCDPAASCTNTAGSFKCECPAGYTGDGTVCTDIDECALATDNCDALATCTNSAGSFTCQCPAGYTGDGTQCLDVDECALGMDNCAALATCTNTAGSFTCQCPTGYTGDGTQCTDIDECALMTTTCAANAQCVNTPGSSSCQCLPGFSGDPSACTCDGTLNFSLLATASASSTFSGYSATHVNDGDESTVQSSAVSWANNWPVAFPQWVELDFPSERVIGRVEMFTSSGYEVVAYDIAVWDGAQWNVVKSVTGNAAVHNSLTFTPVHTSKLRLVASTGAAAQSIYARVNELETYCQ